MYDLIDLVQPGRSPRHQSKVREEEMAKPSRYVGVGVISGNLNPRGFFVSSTFDPTIAEKIITCRSVYKGEVDRLVQEGEDDKRGGATGRERDARREAIWGGGSRAGRKN